MRKLKVVLVEDEEIVLRELEETIDWEGLGLEVVGTAKDGIEGENMIKALSPDIVVTDIKLPGKTGLQMIEDAAVTNGIILSGYTDFEFTKRAIRLGVFDYLEKPVDDDELEASLKTLAEKTRAKVDALKNVTTSISRTSESLADKVRHLAVCDHGVNRQVGLNKISHFLAHDLLPSSLPDAKRFIAALFDARDC